MPEFKKCPPEKSYYLMSVKKGEKFWWCACGLSKNQPFCDSSHKAIGKNPVHFVATEDKDIFFCGCKKTKTPPHCDGSHKIKSEQVPA